MPARIRIRISSLCLLVIAFFTIGSAGYAQKPFTVTGIANVLWWLDGDYDVRYLRVTLLVRNNTSTTLLPVVSFDCGEYVQYRTYYDDYDNPYLENAGCASPIAAQTIAAGQIGSVTLPVAFNPYMHDQGTVRALISSGGGTIPDTALVAMQMSTYSATLVVPARPTVGPKGATRTVSAATTRAEPFTVTNAGTASGTFALSATCGSFGACTVSPTSVTIGGGGSSTATVTYQVPAANALTANISLLAVNSTSSVLRDSATIVARSADVIAPTITLSPGTSLSTLAQGLTLTYCDADGSLGTPTITLNGGTLAPTSSVVVSQAGCHAALRADFTAPPLTRGTNALTSSISDGVHTTNGSWTISYNDSLDVTPLVTAINASHHSGGNVVATDSFLVQNRGATSRTYQFDVSADPGMIQRAQPWVTSWTVPGNSTTLVRVNYLTANTAGTTPIALLASTINSVGAQYVGQATFNAVIDPVVIPRVTPKSTQPTSVSAGMPATQLFRVENIGTAPAPFTMVPVCSGAATNCVINSPPGLPDTGFVRVDYTMAASGTGSVGLAVSTAAGVSPTRADTGRFAVTAADLLPPTISFSPLTYDDDGVLAAIRSRSTVLTVLACDPDGSVAAPMVTFNTSSATPQSVDAPTVAGCLTTRRATFVLPLVSGLNTLTATVTDGLHPVSMQQDFQYDDGADQVPVVRLVAAAPSVPINTIVGDTLVITNPGWHASTYALSWNCDYPPSHTPNCALNFVNGPPSSVVVAAGGTTRLPFTYVSPGTVGATIAMVITASYTNAFGTTFRSISHASRTAPLLPPAIAITPADGAIQRTTSQLNLAINWSDADDPLASHEARYDGQLLTNPIDGYSLTYQARGVWAISMLPGRHTITASVTDSSGHVTNATSYVTFAPATTDVRPMVMPRRTSQSVRSATFVSDTFVVHNMGVYPAAYSLSTVCGSLLSCEITAGTTRTVAPNDSAAVIVRVASAGLAGQRDTVRFIATYSSAVGDVIADTAIKQIVVPLREMAPIVTVAPDSLRMERGVTDVTYFISNPGSDPVTFHIARNTPEPGFSFDDRSGPAVPEWMTVDGGAVRAFGVQLIVSDTGKGHFRLTASYVATNGTALSDSATLVVDARPIVYAIEVTPKDGKYTAYSGAPTYAVDFGVHNRSNTSVSISAAATCDNMPAPCGAANLRFLLAPDAWEGISIAFPSPPTPSGKVKLVASGGTAADSATITVHSDQPYVALDITPKDLALPTKARGTGTRTFVVTNTGTSTANVTYVAHCSGTCFPLSRTTGAIAADRSDTVAIAFQARATPGVDSISLEATNTVPNRSVAVGLIRLLVDNTVTVIVDASSPMPGPNYARSRCVTIAAGSDAAYECGDLRIVHALPSTMTMNIPRTPTLIYNARYATSNALFAATVSIPVGVDSVAGIDAHVLIHPSPSLAAQEYGGHHFAWQSGWSDGTPRRITVPANVGTLPTGLYGAILAVDVVAGGSTNQYRDSTLVAVVNRSRDSFGSGWWLDGLEQLSFNTPDASQVLWVGGDGSTRVYRRAVDSIFVVTPTVDRPDTLLRVANGQVWRRRIGNGAYAEFDAGGRHVATVNAQGYRTSFMYASGDLAFIVLPTPPGAPDMRYTFVRDPAQRNRIVRIDAPTAGTGRDPSMWIGHPYSDELDFIDQDGRAVKFGIDVAGRISSRVDRRGNAVSFAFDGGDGLTSSTISMTTSPSIVRRFCASESASLTSCAGGAVPPGTVATTYDGPRAGNDDVTTFLVNQFGAPKTIIDAMGNTTSIEYGDTRWPLVATAIVGPNGHRVETVLNERGLPSQIRDVNLRSINSSSGHDNATTLYAWGDASCNSPTAVTSPEGVTSRVTYHPGCTVATSQDGRGAATEVRYVPNGNGQIADVFYPETPSGRSAHVDYDALGNESVSRSVMGIATTVYRNAAGFDTLTIAPLDLSGAATRVRTIRDRMERDSVTITVAPRGHLDPVTQRSTYDQSTVDSLVVRTWLNAEGQPDSVMRHMWPNPNGINDLVTRWTYDAVGRKLTETAPDGAVERYQYDDLVNMTSIQDRRSVTTTMTYDRLNRLVSKSLPAVATSGVLGSMLVPAQIDSFSYDATGRLTSATNSFSRITRQYTIGGLLYDEAQSIASADGSFGQHVYETTFDYDLDGRRRHVSYPAQLSAGISTGDGAGIIDYTYGPLGALESVLLPNARQFRYGYDLRGRLIEIVDPSGVRDERRYDEDDHSTLVAQLAASAHLGWFPNDLAREATDTIHADHLELDVAGRVTRLNAYQNGDVLTMAYNGLGAVVYSRRDNPLRIDHQSEDQFIVDPLGNQYQANPQTSATTHVYASSSGRLTSIAPQVVGATSSMSMSYDQAGNQTLVETIRGVAQLIGSQLRVRTFTQSAYDAAGRLRFVRMRGDSVTNVNASVPYEDRYDDEETRYDALGRRVWVSSAHVDAARFPCGVFCSTTRFVWDGDQLLGEIRMPMTAAENDVSPVFTWEPVADSNGITHRDADSVRTYSWRWGRVIYAHGLGIDQPIAITRAEGGYGTNLLDPFTMYPHLNWRGDVAAVSFAGGTPTRFGNPLAAPAIPSEQNEELTAFRDRRGASWAVNDWAGSLVNGQFGENGLEYRRNRYYDPKQGRFTQEDPIGLAGGLNLYGFANGDAVNFADPFGLCPYPGGCNSPLFRLLRLLGTTEGTAAKWEAVGRVGALASGGIGSAVRDVGMAAGQSARANVPVGSVSYSRHPEAAAHIDEAQIAGQPDVVTLSRSGATARRQAALAETPIRSGFDRDEYPPAMTSQGGAGASVKHIDPSDNRGAGASLAAQFRQYPDNTVVRIRTTP